MDDNRVKPRSSLTDRRQFIGIMAGAAAMAGGAARAEEGCETARNTLTLPETAQFDLVSKVNGRAYRLRVAKPLVPAQRDGYPTLFVFDGDAYFGLLADSTRNLSVIGREIAAPLVVAIGYPDDDPTAWHTRRLKDLTPAPPVDDSPMLETFDSGEFGGVDSFLDTIAGEAWDLLGAHYTIDAQRRTVFGHSLGGLAVLHALLERPGMFHGHIAISPTIYWADQTVLSNLAAFARKVRAGDVAPRVYIGVGELEDSLRLENIPPAMHAARRKQAARERMIERAETFARRLQAIEGPAGYKVRFDILAGESHVSAPYSALRPALHLTLPRTS